MPAQQPESVPPAAASDNTHRHALPSGYRLHWYVIDRVLGQGGFGITYLAHDENLNQRVALKEYLPRDLAVRERDDSVQALSGEHDGQFQWGLDRFIAEARTLAQFRHPNIVRVLAVFEANGTAYMAMEYEEGQSLLEILGNRRTLDEMELTRILMPLLHGVEKVHAAGFIHRDIKPANIYIRGDGSPVLLDFGSARQALGQETCTLTSLVSPGYAPFEQYVSKSDKQGPWTDIYGLGATLYRAVTGRVPSVAVDRSEALLESTRDSFQPCAQLVGGGYSARFLRAIDHALAFRPDERPQTIAEWRTELHTGVGAAVPDARTTMISGTRVAAPRPVTRVAKLATAKPMPVTTESSWRRWSVMAAAALLIFWGWRHHARTTASPAPIAAAVSTGSVAAPAVPAPSSSTASATPAQAEMPALQSFNQPDAEASAKPVTAAPAVSATAELSPSSVAGAVKVMPVTAAPDPAADQNSLPLRPELPNATTFNRDPQQRAQLVQRLAAESQAAAQRGDFPRAKRYLDRALRLTPRNANLQQARRKLARLQGGRR